MRGEKKEMKAAIFLLTILAVVGTVFAAVPYSASIAVSPAMIGPGDTLAIYGFVQHTSGQTNYLPLSAMRLKLYKPGTTSGETYINYQSIEFMSNTENPDSLILDGAYLAKTTLTGLSSGSYSVQLLINNEVVGATTFNYESTITRNSTLILSSSYPQLGSYNAEYVIRKERTLDDVDYAVNFFSPTIAGIGTAVYSTNLVVSTTNSSVGVSTFSSPFTNGANVLIITALGNNSDSTLPYIALVRSGEQQAINAEAVLTLDNCTAKEEASRQCSFIVRNTGSYPAVFRITAESTITSQVSFTSSIIQPASNATGTVTLSAVRGDSPIKTLTLNLYHSNTLLDSKTVTVNVETRDLISRVLISNVAISPDTIHPGEEVTATVKLSNTGDFTERVKVSYSIGEDEVNLGTTYSLVPRQNKTVTLTFTAPEEDLVSLSISVLKEDEIIAGRVMNLEVEPFTFSPFADWNTNYKYVEQGNSTENGLKIKNNGNTAGYYEVRVIGDYASLSQRIFLAPSQYMVINVPMLVSQEAPLGPKIINATLCVLSTGECASDTFTLTVLELVRDRSNVVVNSTAQEVSGQEGGVFTIKVENYEGEVHTYSLSIGNFDGELQINPTQLTLMNAQSGTFYVYARPEGDFDQVLAYTVKRENDVINRGNLTIMSSPSGLTGFISLANAGDVGLIVFGGLIIAGLAYIGVKSYTQYKMELKYWK